MNVKMSVGQYNTGCERKVKDIILNLTGGVLPELGHAIMQAGLTVTHLPQPRFTTIGVFLDVTTGFVEKLGPLGPNYVSSFEVTIDEVRSGDSVIIPIIKERWDGCIKKLAQVIHETVTGQNAGHQALAQGEQR